LATKSRIKKIERIIKHGRAMGEWKWSIRSQRMRKATGEKREKKLSRKKRTMGWRERNNETKKKR
jgi:hypothetical protein